MKKRELTELRKSGVSSIEDRITKVRDELTEAHVKLTESQEKNLKVAHNLRRDLAQLLTVKGEMLKMGSTIEAEPEKPKKGGTKK